MSVGYATVQWSRHKVVYDLVVFAAIIVFIGVFIAASLLLAPAGQAPGPEVLVIRATGACAITLLHIILAIGPLARLWPRVLPLLFNRRHLGVITFCIALIHAVIVTGYYHGFGVLNPFDSLLRSSATFISLSAIPFEPFGLVALVALFLLAATSHDFWLKLLGPRAWKSLHMSVYAAYVLLLAHVGFGAAQSNRPGEGTTLLALLGIGAVALSTLHIIAALREVRTDRAPHAVDGPWIDVAAPGDLPLDRARIVSAPGGERIAVFRGGGTIAAITNVCAHQGGPLGEGKVVDGCVTCPWHGWQYRATDGCAPPPFVEKVPTYQVRIVAGRVQVNARALPPGTPTTVVADPESSRRAEVAP